MPNEIYHCPECGEEIDHLKYSCNVTSWGTEYGSADMDGSTTDTDDTEYNDGETSEYEYRCPECDAEIGTVDDWEPSEEVKLKQKQREREEAEAPRDMEDHPTGPLADSVSRYKTVRIFHCLKCGYRRPLDDDEERAVICDQCHQGSNLTDKNTEKY